jgi:2-oxoacid:acceptor oxidoreductase, gamma subunit, pyruvate/2-ketoisovalerate family
MAEIILAGFGGQGVLTAGLILINAAVAQDKQVTWTSSYGAEMRGGTASCSVIVSDEEIGSPYPTMIDMLVVMNEPSYEKFIGRVRKGGCVVVNSSLVKDKEYPKDITVYEIAATDIANQLENPRGANIIMLGALMKASNIMEKEAFLEQLDKYFAKKGKNNPKNKDCFLKGYDESKEV